MEEMLAWIESYQLWPYPIKGQMKPGLMAKLTSILSLTSRTPGVISHSHVFPFLEMEIRVYGLF